MYICRYTHTCIYIHICTYAYMYMYADMYVSIRMQVRTCQMYMHVYTHEYILYLPICLMISSPFLSSNRPLFWASLLRLKAPNVIQASGDCFLAFILGAVLPTKPYVLYSDRPTSHNHYVICPYFPERQKQRPATWF